MLFILLLSLLLIPVDSLLLTEALMGTVYMEMGMDIWICICVCLCICTCICICGAAVGFAIALGKEMLRKQCDTCILLDQYKL